MFKTFAEAAQQGIDCTYYLDNLLKRDGMEIEGETRAKAIMEAHGPKINGLIREAVRLAQGRTNPSERFAVLVEVAEELSKTVTPHLACKTGCSHCCYMSVAVSDLEAVTISRYTGLPMQSKQTARQFLLQSEQMVKKYTGVPCTFLNTKGACSIYPVRPIACRTHHNLGPNSENCRIKGAYRLYNTPVLDFTAISFAAVGIAMQMQSGFADIREYFPNPLDK